MRSAESARSWCQSWSVSARGSLGRGLLYTGKTTLQQPLEARDHHRTTTACRTGSWRPRGGAAAEASPRCGPRGPGTTALRATSRGCWCPLAAGRAHPPDDAHRVLRGRTLGGGGIPRRRARPTGHRRPTRPEPAVRRDAGPCPALRRPGSGRHPALGARALEASGTTPFGPTSSPEFAGRWPPALSASGDQAAGAEYLSKIRWARLPRPGYRRASGSWDPALVRTRAVGPLALDPRRRGSSSCRTPTPPTAPRHRPQHRRPSLFAVGEPPPA